MRSRARAHSPRPLIVAWNISLVSLVCLVHIVAVGLAVVCRVLFAGFRSHRSDMVRSACEFMQYEPCSRANSSNVKLQMQRWQLSQSINLKAQYEHAVSFYVFVIGAVRFAYGSPVLIHAIAHSPNLLIFCGGIFVDYSIGWKRHEEWKKSLLGAGIIHENCFLYLPFTFLPRLCTQKNVWEQAK